MLHKTVRLNTGYSIPVIGLGTYQLARKDCLVTVKAALELGYRHFDTGLGYKNQPMIAQAAENYKREELFYSSKIPPHMHGYKPTIDATEKTLAELKTSYVDLMLVHWPGVHGKDPADPINKSLRHETWKALEDLQEAGKIRSIGVSNFCVRHLEPLLDVCKVKPCVNQFEYHPFYQDEELVKLCKAHGIIVEAYSPLARGLAELFENPVVNSIASSHKKTIAQVLLRWSIQKGCIVIPKTSKEERLKENADIDFELSQSEVEQLNSLNHNHKTCWNSSNIL